MNRYDNNPKILNRQIYVYLPIYRITILYSINGTHITMVLSRDDGRDWRVGRGGTGPGWYEPVKYSKIAHSF